VCFSADGTDIGGALVAQGLAVHYTDYTDGRYAAAEAAARRARRGLWGMKFQPPAEWRQCHAGPVAARPADCPAP
jgi:endonuclease YncB( thermonuclease family)